MNSNILEKIEALPPLDDTIIKIQRICTDRNSSLADLVKVVEGDPMLTANILKASNSPLYGFAREIKNVSHAVSLFGMATVRGFALASVIKRSIKINFSPYGISNGKFLDTSIAQSALMFNWFSKVNREMLDILVPASFMMEVGKIIIANEIIEQNKKDEFRGLIKEIKNPLDVSAIEEQVVGLNNEEVTSRVFRKWNLENELVGAIRYSNNPEKADEHIRPFSTALLVVKKCINIFTKFEEGEIESSLEILTKNNLKHEPFLNAIQKANQ